MRIKALISLIILNTSLAFSQENAFKLDDFYKYDADLAHKTDTIFNSLSDKERIAQMIITSAGELGKSNATVVKLVKENKIGGVVFLKGRKSAHKRLIDSLNTIASAQGQLPLLYSIDAEPSLLNGRLQGTPKLMNTIDIKNNKQSDSIASIINAHLSEIGIQQNYAPVVDISPNNEAIKNRSFGNNKEKVVELSKQFIKTTQEQGIVATAKHFPGHGLVKGDTHEKSVYIDGELQEVDVYKPLINAGVLSIMIAHITVQNNQKYQTNDLPASCSKTIVTDLLKKELGFKGIVITDALNIMKAVTIIKDAPLQASKAGCDVLLMPIDEEKTIESIYQEMQNNKDYKHQVYQSVKKIIRLKLCLRLL